MTHIYSFNDPAIPAVEQVGGKGISLIHLDNKGFKVPPAIILSAAFFLPWMDELKTSMEWEAFSRAEEAEKLRAAEAVKHRALSLTFSNQQKLTLAEVRQYLQSEGITLMAVRSSSPEEDLEGASFAGIYETVLGVIDVGLETAIKTCFASALDERVVAYKQISGYDPRDPKIAVIIQEQVAAEVSGVAFSLNPLNNSYDQCVINANFGLGETVVDGTITPDQWVVDKVSDQIIEKTLGTKHTAVYLKADGGTETRAPESPGDLCLNEDQVLEITELTTRIEAEYGKPMDIEWAYQGGELFLLQARPITTYYKLPEEMITKPGEQKHLYQDGLLSEQGLPEDLSTLAIDVFINFSKHMIPGEPTEEFFTVDQGMAFGSVGRMYTHFGRMVKLMGKKNALKTYRLVDSLGTQILDALDMKEYIPKKFPKGFMKNFIITGLGAVMYVKPLMKARRNPDEYLQHYRDENARLGEELKEDFAREIPFQELNMLISRKAGYHMNAIQLPALMASETARGKLKKLFKNEPEEVKDHLRSIEKSFPHNVTIEMGLSLYELSQLSDVGQISTAEEFVSRLESGQLSPKFMEKWQAFVENFGFRGPKELDIATPRYYEKPGTLFNLLKTMEGHDDPDLNPQTIFDRGAQQRVESVRFLEEYLSKTPGKLKAFKKNYKLLANFGAYRESPKYYIIMVIDYLRRRALALGNQWVAAGRLDSVEQVFDLHLDEFIRAETDSILDIRSRANDNREYYAQFNPDNDPPIVIDSRGFIPKLPLQPRKENELVGTPVSAGIVSGPVKLLRTSDEKPIMPGDILVTIATDPGWTTLFINAGGVLLETGGALQHGASVAREMGKPCIVGIEDLTKMLKDGQTVEMDGTTGIIEILKA